MTKIPQEIIAKAVVCFSHPPRKRNRQLLAEFTKHMRKKLFCKLFGHIQKIDAVGGKLNWCTRCNWYIY